MTANVNCEALLDLVPAYVIGATDEDETRQIESALDQCPELVQEIAVYREAEFRLAGAVPQVPPPAELLDRLLSEARQERRLPRRGRLWWYAAAAACLALFLVGSNLYWFLRLRAAEGQVAVSAQVLTLPTAVNGVETAATAQVVWLPGSDEGVLLAASFPPQPEATVYQAWVTRGTEITSLGTFRVDAQGRGSLTFASDALTIAFDAVGVTLEPMDGSPRPTSPPVVRWQAG